MDTDVGRRPLSLAKLTAPQPNRAWPRRSLFERLDAARRNGNIIWVAAPAGSGKTTLVASYLQARRLRAAWYRIDAADTDAASFFHHLAQAVAPGTRREAAALPAFTAEYLAGLAVFAHNWFRRFFARMRGVPLLVLDDYHQLPADSPVHVALREGLAEVPPGASVIVTSRGEPPPLLTRLRTLENFTLLDREALRLSADECIAIARQRLAGGAVVGEAALRSLHERTQGWVAGLVLMLERGPAAALGEAAPADPLVFDYFAGELLAQAEPRLQRFLLLTALLPRFTAASAAALSGQDDAATLLAELDRRNFFIARHAGSGLGDAWEYHPLFREFLLERGRRQLAADELARLRREAAGLLAAEGDPQASMALLREAGDWPRLVSQVLEQAPALLRSGRLPTLSEWILGIPEAQRAGTPWLDYFLGLCRLPYDPAQARELLSSAYMGFRAAGHAVGEYLSWAGVVDTFIYAWSDFTPSDPWIDEFDALRARHPQFPSREIEVRAVAAIFAILMYRRPQHPELPRWTRHLDALVAQDIDPALRMTAAAHLLLFYEWWAGNLARANELVRRIEPFASARTVGPFVRLAWEGILAISHWMNAENDAALAAVRRGLALADETGAHVWDFMLLAQGAVAAATSGDAEQARDFLARLRAREPGQRRLDSIQYHFFSFQEAMRRDDRAEMLAHGHAALASAVEAGAAWGEVYARPALAQALFLAGDEAGARRELERAAQLAAAIGCSNAFYYMHELEAQFAEARGDRPARLASIARMFQVMREQGFANSAWWRDDAMARWCRIALEHSIETDFVRALIRRRGLRPDGPAARLEHWPWPVRVRTLGEFAIELDGEPLRFAGKVQKRPLALLKALVAFGCVGVPEAQLAEALWPDAEGDDAHNAFVTTLQRLRKLLGQRDALLLQEGRLSLDAQLCWVDTLAFESVDLGDGDAAVADDRERALLLYRGAFLAQEDAPWAIAPRERLRARFVRLGGADVRHHLEGADWDGAVACLERLLQADATVEPFYQQLMRAHHRLGRSAEVLATYRRCRDVLGATLHVPPSASTEALLRELGVGGRTA
jgi:LuxR family transcriptional regulator, maltose regulon positive regulatory protein